jgi:hypothetical protein
MARITKHELKRSLPFVKVVSREAAHAVAEWSERGNVGCEGGKQRQERSRAGGKCAIWAPICALGDAVLFASIHRNVKPYALPLENGL